MTNTTTNTTITTLKSMPYAQAKVVFSQYGITLVSYDTPVAGIDTDGNVRVNGLYSTTTRRHLSVFARDYCGTNYYTLKRCYEENLMYNIYRKDFVDCKTGEVVDVLS